MPVARGEAYQDLGHVLQLAGKTEEAERAVEKAVEIFDAKGAVAMSQRARQMAAVLEVGAG